MRKFNDTRMFFYISLVLTLVALLLVPVAYYSIMVVEPEVRSLLEAPEGISANYKKAYLILRDPHVFARYENFDAAAEPVKAILRDFDRRVYNGDSFVADDRLYLEILFERRILGSRLTRNTVIFFTLLALVSWGVFLYERRKNT